MNTLKFTIHHTSYTPIITSSCSDNSLGISALYKFSELWNPAKNHHAYKTLHCPGNSVGRWQNGNFINSYAKTPQQVVINSTTPLTNPTVYLPSSHVFCIKPFSNIHAQIWININYSLAFSSVLALLYTFMMYAHCHPMRLLAYVRPRPTFTLPSHICATFSYAHCIGTFIHLIFEIVV